MTETRILPMTMDDYPAAMALWKTTPGIGLSAADEAETMRAYLLRNPADKALVWDDLCLAREVQARRHNR